MLKIALLGASGPQVAQLAAALNDAVKASGWPALVFASPPTLPAALASFGLVLLMGLESPAPAPQEAQTVEAADQSIRAALAAAAVAYRVLYGASHERLAHALQAIESLLAPARPRQQAASAAGPAGIKNQPWVWMCDKCSDPQCEHRLLTALLAQRARAAY